MSTDLQPVTLIEIDMDRCTRSYGVAPCAALLGDTGVRKCYNTWQTCQDRANYVQGSKTLRYSEPLEGLPRDVTRYPVVEDVSAVSASVNLAGQDPRSAPLGAAAEITVTLRDFVDNDRETDPYARERETGTAQTDEPGYRPIDRGTHFGKMKIRWPHYANRPLRLIKAYIYNGAIVDQVIRNYIIQEMEGPNSDGRMRIKARDPLHITDDTLCPPISRGELAAGITDVATSFTVTPAGIGATYPASGRVLIGSEIIAYTRVADTFTVTSRAVSRTLAAAHTAGDSVQEVAFWVDARVDDVYESLLTTYAPLNPSFIPKALEWTPEVDVWLPEVLLTTDVVRPTKVRDLLGEIGVLGVSLYWDEVDQKVRLKANRPPFGETVLELNDARGTIKDIRQVDRDEDRITQVLVYYRQTDPTKDLRDGSNYDIGRGFVDTEAERSEAYGDTKPRVIYCRWFNGGSGDTYVRLFAQRLINRFKTAPVEYKVKLDISERDIKLTDVLRLSSDTLQDVTGKPRKKRVQVAARWEPITDEEIELTVQSYAFASKYALIAPNDTPVYGSATDEQKEKYGFIVDSVTLTFPDGEGPYVLI